MNLIISSKRLAYNLIFIVLSLNVISLAGQLVIRFTGNKSFLISNLVKSFNVDGEFNIPTLYSGLALLLCSILLATIADFKRVNKDRYNIHWKVLSFIFLYLSLDECFQIHETVNTVLNKALQSAPNTYWDVLNCIFVFLFVFGYWKFFFHLPAKTRRLFFIASLSFIVGAIGIELIGVYFFQNIYHQHLFISEVVTTVEEFLEMIGIVIFIYALISYMSLYVKNMQISIID